MPDDIKGATIANSSLSTWLMDDLFHRLKTTRGPLEEKWHRNHSAFACDVSQDPKGAWKRGENDSQYSSDTVFDITRQKVNTAHDIIMDAGFRNNVVPVGVEVAKISENEPIEGEEQIVYNSEDCERKLKFQMAQTLAVKEFSAMAFIGAEYGEMWLKKRMGEFDLTPLPYQNESGTWLLKKRKMKSVFVEHKTVWQMYRDLEEDDPINGSLVEVNAKSISDILDMKGTSPLIDDDAIDRIAMRFAGKDVENASGEATGDEGETPPDKRGIAQKAKGIKLYEFWANIPIEHMDNFESKENDFDQLPTLSGKREEAFILMTSDGTLHEIIAFKRKPGEKPYKWERFDENPEELGGQGIADRVEPQQRTLNGAIRSFENNVKAQAQLILAVKERNIKGNIKDAFRDGGVIELTDEAESVKDAIEQFLAQDVTAPLLRIIQLFLDFADYSSGVPRIQQGVQPEGARTAYELQQRLQGAGKYFGDIFMRIDRMIEWAAYQYFVYDLSSDEFPECKGPYIIKALGYLAYSNMVQRVQGLIQFLQLVSVDPETAKQIDRRWVAEQVADAYDIDKDKILKSLAVIAEEQKAEQNSPQAQLQMQQMDLTVKSLAAEVDTKLAEVQKIQAETAEIMADIESSKREVDTRKMEAYNKAGQGLSAGAKQQ